MLFLALPRWMVQMEGEKAAGREQRKGALVGASNSSGGIRCFPRQQLHMLSHVDVHL